MKFSSDTILATGQDAIEEANFEDFDIQFAYGLTETDVAALADLPDVDQVEGGYSTAGIALLPSGNRTVKVLSLTKDINKTTVVEGALPSGTNEIAVEKAFADACGLHLGDTLTINSTDEIISLETFETSRDSYLLADTFTIVGIVNQAGYVLPIDSASRGAISFGSGKANNYAVVAPEAFNQKALSGCYTILYATSEKVGRYDFYTEEYDDAFREVKAEIETLGTALGNARYNNIKGTVSELIAGYEQQLADALTQIESGRSQLEAGLAQLRTVAAWFGLGDDFDAAADACEQVAAFIDSILGWLHLGSGDEASVAAGLQVSFASADARGFSGRMTELLASSGYSTDRTVASQEIAHDAVQNPTTGRFLNLVSQVSSLSNQLWSYRSGLAAYRTGQQTLADAEAAYTSGLAQLDAAKQRAEEMLVEHSWAVFGTSGNASLVFLVNNAKNLDNLAGTFALLFILVGIMVCYASMARLVNEQAQTIGMQKAFGSHTREIVGHYLIYAALCSIIGCALGFLVVTPLVERLALKAYSALFTFTSYNIQYGYLAAFITLLVATVIICLAAYIACRGLIKKPATELLRGEPVASSIGANKLDEISAWRKLPLLTRTMFKNLFGDKKRMLMAIVGIAGCTALLVVSLSLKFDVGSMEKAQFEGVINYDMRLYTDARAGANEADAFEQALGTLAETEGIDSVRVSERSIGYRAWGSTWDAAKIISSRDASRLSDFYTLRDIETGETLTIPESGVLVSRRIAERYEVGVGDSIELLSGAGDSCQTTVEGIFENYCDNYIFVNAAYYEAMFGTSIDDSTFYIHSNGVEESVLTEALGGIEGYIICENLDMDRALFNKASSALNLVVLVCIILSALLAAMVLLNLCIMFVNRKARELAIMRVNGFSMHETKAYIYRDNIALTIIGLIIGVALGIVLTIFTVASVENAMHIPRDPSWIAIALACVINALFMLVITLISLRKIDKLNLTQVSGN